MNSASTAAATHRTRSTPFALDEREAVDGLVEQRIVARLDDEQPQPVLPAVQPTRTAVAAQVPVSVDLSTRARFIGLEPIAQVLAHERIEIGGMRGEHDVDTRVHAVNRAGTTRPVRAQRAIVGARRR